MEFEKLITDRYSVRNFTEEHLPKEVIDKILEAGHKAPTGCNYQPQRILILNTDNAIEKLKGCTKCTSTLPQLCSYATIPTKAGSVPMMVHYPLLLTLLL